MAINPFEDTVVLTIIVVGDGEYLQGLIIIKSIEYFYRIGIRILFHPLRIIPPFVHIRFSSPEWERPMNETVDESLNSIVIENNTHSVTS